MLTVNEKTGSYVADGTWPEWVKKISVKRSPSVPTLLLAEKVPDRASVILSRRAVLMSEPVRKHA